MDAKVCVQQGINVVNNQQRQSDDYCYDETLFRQKSLEIEISTDSALDCVFGFESLLDPD